MDNHYHPDGTISYWSVYRQVWVDHVDYRDVPDDELAAMSTSERDIIQRHIECDNFDLPAEEI